MSATPTADAVKFDIIRPKREPRPVAAKKRVTIDANVSAKALRREAIEAARAEAKASKKGKQGAGKSSSSLPPLDDDSDNQGFAEWLRSSDGVDMMRLFVIGNSLLVLVTMAWPHMQQSLDVLRELVFGEEEA